MAIGKNGILAIWKPKGISSFGALSKFRRTWPGVKIGHAGTLDPLAEGVLVIGIGRRNTRKLGAYKGVLKEYEATIGIGQYSSTDDEEGDKEFVSNRRPDIGEINSALINFRGEITQLPPIFSAVKKDGMPAYRYARKGIIPDLPPRKVFVYQLSVCSYSWPELGLKIVCSGGTYIRALARDLGTFMKTGAYLRNLVRTRVGVFSAENALRI